MTTAEKVAGIKSRLSIPAFAAPMFIISGPDLVIEACKAGVIGEPEIHFLTEAE